MKELVKRTTIPRTLPEDVPSCERLKTEVLLDVTAVFLPPPGVALYPPIVPVPVPSSGRRESVALPDKYIILGRVSVGVRVLKASVRRLR